jgi:hypothetical protein
MFGIFYGVHERLADNDLPLPLGLNALTGFDGAVHYPRRTYVKKHRKENERRKTQTTPIRCSFARTLIQQLLLAPPPARRP